MKILRSSLVLFFTFLMCGTLAKAQNVQVYLSTVSLGVVHVSIQLNFSSSAQLTYGFYPGGTHGTSGTYSGQIEDDSDRVATYGVLAETIDCTDAQLDQLYTDIHDYDFDYNILYTNCGSLIDCDLEVDLGIRPGEHYYQNLAESATLFDWLTEAEYFFSDPLLSIVMDYYVPNWEFFTDLLASDEAQDEYYYDMYAFYGDSMYDYGWEGPY